MTAPTEHAPAVDPTSSLVVVTGASRGIGRALAEGFADAGHPVLVTARSADSARAAAVGIVDRSCVHVDGAEVTPRVRGIALDVTAPDSVAAFTDEVSRVAAEWDAPLRTLVNNAGTVEASEGPIWEVDAEDMASVIETNLIGVFRVVRALVPTLLESAAQSGEPVRIIDLNSGSGASGTTAHAAYSASKAGLFRLAQSLVDHGHDRGLRVFEMAPGVVASDMTRSMPMHDHRTGDDWTPPQAVVQLALALASGRLDAWTGRYVRAGVDTPESLESAADTLTPGDLGDGFRTLAVRMQ
ncbi:Short-chain dehydrogenase [Brevibacterium sp. Mu109]|uniref:SDR family oxidoreductase n=1 Tax=Brevibacterium sp. Mu109 TaxID=1255669 RepID=UPI000C3A33C4|nr:SDR family oxidoreductase [Brevibacterium sp. Mu109]SMX69509.1 Short-chain dehydrogenase [Brevibacterium sp. Mu109]